MTFALLDGDVIAYQAALKGEEDIDWGDGQDGKTVDVATALRVARKLIEDWRKLARRPVPIVCLSPRDGTNFRKLIDSDYKSGRGEKPQVYWDVIDMIEAEYRFYREPYLEADDLLGITSTNPRFTQPVVVSTDKDLRTIPGLLVMPGKDTQPRKIRPQDADAFWMQQVMMGDQTDGYPGCPGVGLKGAQAMLSRPTVHHAIKTRITRGKRKGTFKTTWGQRPAGTLWEGIVSIYERAGLNEDAAIHQARLARILRHGDFDKENQEVKLWHPCKEPTMLSLSGTPRRSKGSG